MPNIFTKSPLFGTLLQDKDVTNAFAAPDMLQQILVFERAWTEALIAVGNVNEADGTLALTAIKKFPTSDFRALNIENDGLPVPEIIRQLRKSCPEAGRAAIHTGATSQDVLDTAMLLVCRGLFDDFDRRIKEVAANLDRLRDQFGGNKMMGRTRMQAALPIVVADRIATWAAPLNALQNAPFDRDTVQVGGPVGLRDMANGEKVAAHVAVSLGLSVGEIWHTDRSIIVDMGHRLTKLTGALGKIGQDIALMAQQGVDEITLSGGGTSSAMPHKQNPVRAETLIALARFVAMQQGGLAQALIHEQERSGAAWTLEWLTLPAMFEATGAALNNAIALTCQIERMGQP